IGLLEVLVMKQAPAWYAVWRRALGDGQWSAFLAELMVSATVFAMPTVLMGAQFAHLVQSARHTGKGIGQAASLNLFGGALASAVFATGFLPRLESKWTL